VIPVAEVRQAEGRLGVGGEAHGHGRDDRLGMLDVAGVHREEPGIIPWIRGCRVLRMCNWVPRLSEVASAFDKRHPVLCWVRGLWEWIP